MVREDLSKYTPTGWYARLGDEVIKHDLVTGVLTVEPYIENEDD